MIWNQSIGEFWDLSEIENFTLNFELFLNILIEINTKKHEASVKLLFVFVSKI